MTIVSTFGGNLTHQVVKSLLKEETGTGTDESREGMTEVSCKEIGCDPIWNSNASVAVQTHSVTQKASSSQTTLSEKKTSDKATQLCFLRQFKTSDKGNNLNT